MKLDDVDLGKQILHDFYLAGNLLCDSENSQTRHALFHMKNFLTTFWKAIMLSFYVHVLTQLCQF
jgi:hypothetical protein